MELMVTVAIAGIIAAMAVPSFMDMMSTAKTRGAAENIIAGIRLARSEAIKRNTVVRFQLVSTLDDNCILSTTSMFWVVNQSHTDTANLYYRLPTGHCAASAFSPPDQPDPCDPAPTNQPAANPACEEDPFIIQKSDGRTTTAFSVDADGSSIAFGPIGQVVASNMTRVNIIPTGETDPAWRVVIGAGGSAKLCDPSLAAGNTMSCS